MLNPVALAPAALFPVTLAPIALVAVALFLAVHVLIATVPAAILLPMPGSPSSYLATPVVA